MTDKKLTDSEIVKALECCVESNSCSKCPFVDIADIRVCTTELSKNALDLINRLQEEKEESQQLIDHLEAENYVLMEDKEKLKAENERLKSKLEPQGFEEADPMDFCGVLCDFAEGLIEKSKAEAFKELTEMIYETTWYHINENGELVQGANSETDIPLYKAKDVHNLLKEMVGEDNESKNK